METRRIKILIFTIVLFLIPSFSNIYGATLSKPANNLGLVGYWSFNEGTSTQATDFSGRGNTGTLTNMAVPATASSGWGNGKLGGGLKFDGNNDWVEVANSPAFGITGDIAITAWIKLNTSNDYGGILAKGNGTDSWDYEFYICGDSQCTSGSLGLFSNNVAPQESNIVINDLNWHHVAVTRSGSTITFYIDGVSAGTQINSNAFTNNAHPIRIGTDGPTWNAVSAFNGSIDEVRLYNRTLTITEIRRLYESGSAKVNASQNNLITNGLLGMWSFDSKDTVSTIAYDRIGGNNGTISGSPRKSIGKSGQSLNFDGSTNMVNAGSASSMDNPSAITISSWIKISASGGGRLVSKSGGANQGFYLHVFDSGYIQFGAEYNTTSLINDYTFTSVANEWAHIVLTWDGSTSASNAILYINGVVINPAATQNGVGVRANDSAADFMMGARSDTGACCFLGNMDEVRYYNRVLSPSEVKTLYNAGESKINASQNIIQGSSLNSGLVGMWSFNSKDLSDRVYDRSGQGNDGYIYNVSTGTAKIFGKVGQALKFNGASSQYVSIANGGGLNNLQTGTIAFWAKWSGTQDEDTDPGAKYGAVLARQSNGVFTNQMISLDTANPATAHVRFATYTNNPNVTGTTVVGDGRWRHIVVTYQSGSQVLYVDGVQDGSDTATGSIGNNTGVPLTIGGWIGDGGSYSSAVVDEVRIYNRILTPSEVKQLYLSGR